MNLYFIILVIKQELKVQKILNKLLMMQQEDLNTIKDNKKKDNKHCKKLQK